MSLTLESRFWSKVDAEGDCWEWTASTNPGGYGRFSVDHDTIRPAHRVAWELLVGPIPEGLTLDHLCRNVRCVNPDHLEPVSMRENTRRGYNPAARNARRTHCVHGHPLSGPNLIVDSLGRRVCRACRVDVRRRYYRKARHTP